MTWDESIQRWTGRLPRAERGRRPKVTGKTKREAERKLERKRAEREQGILGAGRMTVNQFLEQWVRDTLNVADLADSTKAKHEIAVRLHLVPAVGRIKLVKLTPMHVQRFLRDELAARRPSSRRTRRCGWRSSRRCRGAWSPATSPRWSTA